MKRSLFDPSTEREVVARVLLLRVDTKPRWGAMNATEMLYHCNLSNQQVLEEVAAYKIPSFTVRVKKLIVFHFLSHIPRNNKGPARTHTKEKIRDDQFEMQRRKYKELIHGLVNHERPFRAIHPALGFLTMKEWGVILWMHMDHHLRQFGV